MYVLSTSALVALVTLAAALDTRTRRIPNVLTVSALFVALALRSFLGGGALLDGVQGAGLAMLLVLPLFALGGLGGGDLKLLVAVGAFLGPRDLMVALLVTAVAGGVLALVETIRRGVVLPMLLDTAGFARYCFTFGHSGSRPTLGAEGSVSVPYGIAIAIGSLTAWFLPLAEWVR
jgi:prepilin peptidase CpaA